MSVTSWIRRSFKDGVITTATTTMTNVATSFSVGTGQGSSFPDGSIGPFILTVDQGQAAEEKILVQSRSADTFTVAASGRGYNGTTAQAHTNAVVLHTIDAQDLDEANQAAVQTVGAVQASGDLLQGAGANSLQRLARGSANQFLQAGASLLQWVGFGVGQSTISAVGDTAADGSQTTPARSDHKHGREAFGVGLSATVTTANADGAATTLARADHAHQGVASAFGRNGAVVATSGDYTAAQVTNAADKASSSQQAFTGELKTPDLVVTGLTGATAASRLVGANTSGPPTSGTFAKGDVEVDQTGTMWVCITAGSPGTWVQVGLPTTLDGVCIGSAPSASTPLHVMEGSFVVTTNGAAGWTRTFPTAFATGYSVVCSPGDNAGNLSQCPLSLASCSLTNIAGLALDKNGNAIISTPVRINYRAIGA